MFRSITYRLMIFLFYVTETILEGEHSVGINCFGNKNMVYVRKTKIGEAKRIKLQVKELRVNYNNKIIFHQ